MNSDLYSESNEQYQSKIRFLLLVIFFIFSFIPIVPISLNGISINYSFMLLPAYIILKKNLVIVKPPETIMWGLAIFSFIFILACLYQTSQYEIFVRRFGSFLIFMSIFSFSIIHIEEKLMLAFKQGVIFISGVLSLISIIGFFEMQSAGGIHFGLKEEIGSQRFGFIYLLAFWILLYDLKKGSNSRVINSILTMIIVSGLFLTFSRSSMVAFFVPLLLFIIINFRFSWFFRFQKLKQLTLMIIFLIIMFWVVYQNFPIAFEYYTDRLLNPLLDMSLFEETKYPGSSEGIRLYRLQEVMNYAMLNPFTGSGYLGVWAISETGSGSAHGQLNDVLLRVGLFGFIFYVYLGICLLTFLWKLDKSLFWGMMSIVIYGFFHETFKESQGAVILAFLIGVYSQYLRKKNIAYLSKKSKYLNS
jgi:hypothetical protein